MKVTATAEFDIFGLFIHDYEPGCDPFDEHCVAEVINKSLSKEGLEYELEPPDMGRSWKIVSLAGRYPEKRVYSVEEAKTHIGIESSALLAVLEKVNNGDIKL